MKKALILLLAMIPVLTQGQVMEALVDTTKLWSSVVQQIFPPAYTKSHYVKFNGDTIVDSQHYAKVWTSEDSLMLSWNLDGIIREDINHQVFYRPISGTVDHLIYDFGMQVGDTIQLWNQNFPKLRLSLIDSIYIYDKYVKRFSFDPLSPKQGESRQNANVWYEGIGDLCGVLNSGMDQMVGQVLDLLCYFEDDVLKYHHSGYTSCYQNIVGMSEVEGYNRCHSVYPNPVTSHSTLEYVSLTGEAAEVFIYSVTGQLIRQSKIVSSIELNHSDFNPGHYFYVIYETDGYACGRFSVK